MRAPSPSPLLVSSSLFSNGGAIIIISPSPLADKHWSSSTLTIPTTNHHDRSHRFNLTSRDPQPDVWTSDAALVGGGSETSGLATQIVWGVGAYMFAFDAALVDGGTETDCTSDAARLVC
ncbi:hypothetical protein F2Q70_00004837 [Brassica cretica]|uniref:Uncharacterized protein n=2 Tax=Brassica cretica TaxID=69181 RepID=A0A8S9FWY3_BRACR|nr:hypothetical protein F2Q68_00021610 [Brassica cretica]KAF2576011.1 hypothetical protein F2Q70_00004837 [Brassica cretica]